MDNLCKGPPRSLYKEYTPLIYFSYQPGRKSFQQGYFGITGNVSIVGFLHLRFPKHQPLYARKIRVSFSGTECVRFGGMVPTNETNSICNVTTELWRNPDNDYQEISKMNLPFEIPLPLDIPSSLSVDRGRGKIEYNLRAIISCKSDIQNFKGSTMIIQCAHIIDSYILPPIPEPIMWQDDRSKQGVGHEILLINKIFGPCYPIVVRVKLTFYDPRVSLEDIVIGLKEYTAISTQTEIKKKSTYIGQKIVKGRKIPITQCNECSTDITFTIPEDCVCKPTWSNEGFNIEITHKVKIKVRFGCFSKYNINLEAPVKIINMLNEEEEAYLTAEILHQQEISRYLEPETQTRSNSPPPSYEPNWFTNQTSHPPSYSLSTETD
jgi:hypothetical protein